MSYFWQVFSATCMRLIFTFFLVVAFMAWSGSGCKQRTRTYLPTPTVIEGIVDDATIPFIQLKGDNTLSSTIDSAGHFNISATLDKAGIYRLVTGGQTLFVYIVPGKRIQLAASYPQLERNAVFSGDLSNENNYLNEYIKQKNGPSWYSADSIANMEETTYTSAIEQHLANLLSNQQDWQKEKGAFESDFATLMSEELSYNAAIMKMQYPLIQYRLTKDTVPTISDTYDSFLQNIEIDNEDNLMIPAYQEFIEVYLSYKIAGDTSNLTTSALKKKFAFVEGVFQSGPVREYAYYSLMVNALQTSLNDAFALFPDFMRRVYSPEYRKTMQEMIDQRQHLLPGSEAPDLSFFTLEGGKTSLRNWKGKVLYLSLWETGCSRCFEEMTALEDIQEKLKKNREVVFVCVSLDRDERLWKSTLKENKLPGIQLRASGENAKQKKKDYMVTSIPRYVLIGKDGLILDANAPGPASGILLEVLQEASASRIQ